MNDSLPRKRLPSRPSLEHLQKQAKRLTKQNPKLKLAEAQHQLAREYGCKNWAELVGQVESMLRGGKSDPMEEMQAAMRGADMETVLRLLDEQSGLLTPALWPAAIHDAKSLELTRILLDRGLSPDECTAPRKPLHLAVYQGLPEIVELLIARGANVNLRNPLGETPLDLLDAYDPRPVGDPSVRRIFRALRDAGAEEDFLALVRIGDADRVRERLLEDASLATSDSDQGGPLFAAARSGRPEILSLLLGSGGNPNKINARGNTPLWFAAQSMAKPASGRIAAMKILLEAGAQINQRCEDGTAALHFAAWRGPVEVVEFLLAHGADSELRNDQGETPLELARAASVAEDKDLICARLERPPSPQPDEQIIGTVLRNDLTGLRRLLDAHPAKIALTGGPWNKPLLHCAAWEGHIAIARELLERGAEVNARCGSDHACAIHFAAERGHLEIVKLLADAGADLEAGDNDHQLNVLGWATALGHCQQETARFLLSRGARMSIWSAVSLGDAKTVRSLVQANPAALQARMSRNEYSRTPLHQAVHAGKPEMVRLLLELGADPDARDAMGLGPVGASMGIPGEEILAILEDSSRTPGLYDALLLGRFEQAEELLARNPGCLAPGGTEAKLFVYAVVRKNWRVAEWLLEHGCDPSAVAEVYQCPATALHFLVEQGNLERIRWLLEKGADCVIRDGKYGANVLGWADFFGNAEAAELIRGHQARAVSSANGRLRKPQ